MELVSPVAVPGALWIFLPLSMTRLIPGVQVLTTAPLAGFLRVHRSRTHFALNCVCVFFRTRGVYVSSVHSLSLELCTGLVSPVHSLSLELCTELVSPVAVQGAPGRFSFFVSLGVGLPGRCRPYTLCLCICVRKSSSYDVSIAPRASQLWEALGGSGRLWEALGGSGRLWETLGGSGRLWEALGSPGRLWEALGGSGRQALVLWCHNKASPLAGRILKKLCR